MMKKKDNLNELIIQEQFIDKLTDKIKEIYYIYENYAWNDEDRRIIGAIFHKNGKISLYVYDGMELIDEVNIAFGEEELDLFRALSLRMFSFMIGNVMVYRFQDNKEKDCYIYYNEKRKPYLYIVAKDENIRQDIDLMVDNQMNEWINMDNAIIKERTEVASSRIYDDSVLEIFEKKKSVAKILTKE